MYKLHQVAIKSVKYGKNHRTMQLFLLAFSVLLFCEYRAEDVADYDPTYALLQAGSDTHFEPIPVQM